MYQSQQLESEPLPYLLFCNTILLTNRTSISNGVSASKTIGGRRSQIWLSMHFDSFCESGNDWEQRPKLLLTKSSRLRIDSWHIFWRRADSLQSLAPVSWRWQTGKLVWWGFHCWIDESRHEPDWYRIHQLKLTFSLRRWVQPQKETIVFQPSILGAFAVSFREGNFGCFTNYSFRRSCHILNNHGMKFLSRVPLNKLILACGRAQRPSRKRGPVCRNGTLFLWGKLWRFFSIQCKICKI